MASEHGKKHDRSCFTKRKNKCDVGIKITLLGILGIIFLQKIKLWCGILITSEKKENHLHFRVGNSSDLFQLHRLLISIFFKFLQALWNRKSQRPLNVDYGAEFFSITAKPDTGLFFFVSFFFNPCKSSARNSAIEIPEMLHFYFSIRL